MTEKISVIIPLYNKSSYIARALNSVLNQTYQNFEIIVVDDGSTDNGAKIVRDFIDPRIRLIEQENRGVSAARNRGVDEAISDFIAFLDADDEWMPHHLETIIRLMDKYPDVGMYSTAYQIRTKEGKTSWANYKYIPTPPWEGLLPDYFRSAALGDYPVGASGVVIPKKIFHEMGGFPQGYWYGEDADLFGRIALKYPVAFSWEFGAICHQDASDRASDKTSPLDYEEPFVKSARTALMKGEIPPQLVDSVNEHISKMEIIRAVRNVRGGNSQEAQKILKKCTTRWFSRQKIIWTILAKIPYPLFCFFRKIKMKIAMLFRMHET